MAPQAVRVADDMEKEKEVENGANNKKVTPPNGSKVCGVCGDKAFGYNFNAVTCESCKAFFRRNALVSKEFRCPFTEQCDITVVTRRFCQKCRLEKCFSIGMAKEYIMSDEDKAQKRLKIAENRAKKRQGVKSGDDEVSSSKLIKREDNDDSSNSWTQNGKQPSPTTLEEQRSESPDRLPVDIHLNSHNQTVSVIKNSAVNSNATNETVQYNMLNKPNDFDVNFNNYNTSLPLSSQGVNLNLNAGHDIGSNPLNDINETFDHSLLVQNSQSRDSTHLRFGLNEQEDDHVMIRSMLTAPTPNSDSARTFTNAPRSQYPAAQVLCDSTLTNGLNVNQPSKADVARDVLQDVESIYRIPVEPNSIESILCEAIKLEFEAYTSLSQINTSSRELNDAERAKLNELIVANKALLAPLDEDHVNSLVSDEYRFKPSQGQNNPTLLGIINLTAVAIRRLIKMSKKINAFKNMCEEDQVALLKGGCTEMMILRSTMTYDCARDTWKIPHSQESMSNIKAEVLKLAKGNIYGEHDRFIRTFDPRWRMDENIILIMCAIVLFTPDRPRVVHSDVIKLEQNSYYYLLRRYLESIYPGCEAKSTFLKLIQKIMELHKLTDEVIGVYLDVNPSHVEPLLIEIFDLKQQH